MCPVKKSIIRMISSFIMKSYSVVDKKLLKKKKYKKRNNFVLTLTANF